MIGLQTLSRRPAMIESGYLKQNPEMLRTLKKIPTFAPFDDTELQRLLSMSKVRKYRKGEMIVQEGVFESWLYFIMSGRVRIEKGGRELLVLGAKGDVFGEMAFIDGSARSASVFALEDTICMATDTFYAKELTGQDKIAFNYVIYRLVAEILAVRLRATSDELVRGRSKVSWKSFKALIPGA
jgi:CRP-like cAMP-binding protein